MNVVLKGENVCGHHSVVNRAVRRVRVVYLSRADKSEQPVGGRLGVVKKENFSLTPELPHLVYSHVTAYGGLCGPLPAGSATSTLLPSVAHSP
jgi:hypothetical protein